jgi:mannose-6-phosphate isomerase-like protein (cupin superfamily)
MSEAARPHLTPIALGNEEGEAFWFFGALATIKASSETTGGRVAVIEHLAPQGVASPMHVHHNEDEWFYITEGAVTFWVGGKIFQASVGSFVYGPREIPHTFLVISPEARFLLVAEPAGLEKFVRILGVPATARTAPPSSIQLPSPDQATYVAAQFGIEILGPPGIPK